MLTWIKRKIDFKRKGIKIWMPCNVYPTAKLGKHVSIGRFSEIGHEVVIGDYTRIGMGVFIPEGVVVGKHCFIGPKVCMVHDIMMQVPPFTPLHKARWEGITIHDNVRLGANVMINPGIMIGEGAIVGLGSVVTRDVGANEVWAGNPARKLRDL